MLLEPERATAAAAAAAAAGGTAAAAAPAPPPPPGSLLDITPRQCATNLPLLDELGGADAPDEAEGELSPHGEDGGGADKEVIAHGPRFVGRHLEMHAVIHAVHSSHLTAVYGAKGGRTPTPTPTLALTLTRTLTLTLSPNPKP